MSTHTPISTTIKRLGGAILIILSLSNLLTGCDGGETIHESKESISDLYVFRVSNTGVPYKTSLVSGTTSTVCIDPLCLHDDDCPLDESSYFGIPLGEYYCFVRGTISTMQGSDVRSGVTELCAYHLTSGECRVLVTYEDDIELLYGDGNYLYYTVAEYRESETDNLFHYAYYRVDITNGKMITLPLEYERADSGSQGVSDFPCLYTIDGDCVYWYEAAENGYIFYTTDLAGKNRCALELASPRVMNGEYHDGWAYYKNADGGLSRYHMESGKDSALCETIAAYIVTEAGIFYTVTESEPREIRWNNEVYYDLYGGKIYRMNLDGSDAKLLCTLDGVDLSVTLFSPFLGYHDGKLALAFMDKVENDYYESGYDYNTSPDVILLDTEALTWEISEN